MARDALSRINTQVTPQGEQADPRQVPNSAGGYTFTVSEDTMVNRFLTLGVEGGTYYTTETALARENANVIIAAAQDRGEWLVQRIVEISQAGRAPKQNPAIFALAVVAKLGTEAAARAAYQALPLVVRTASSLYTWIGYVEQFGGSGGNGTKRAINRWLLGKGADGLAYQFAKYRSRNGWSNKDVLRIGHPRTTDPALKAAFDWTCGRPLTDAAPALLHAFAEAQGGATNARIIELINEHPLSWEMLPDTAVTNGDVWRALIAKGVPQTALMRQLPRLTNLGILDGDTLRTVVAQLQDPERLRKGRVHPINVLQALKTYSSGQSLMGSSTWTPKRQITDALDSAFYGAFPTVEPANKRYLLALDISGSMGSAAMGAQSGRGPVWGYASPGQLSCREVTAALALVNMAIEPECDVVGFSRDLIELNISPRQRLDDAVRTISGLPFGSTDCAAPMVWAQRNRKDYDQIVVLTDNETWAGSIHPHQALANYRQAVGHDVGFIVAALTPTSFTIADPADPRSLDISGFDSNVPNLITDFARGDV